MERLVKAGAFAALAQALLYIIGFAVLAAFQPNDAASWTAAQKLSYTLAHGNLTQFWALLYYASGIALVVLTVGIHERLHKHAPVLMPITTPFGYIWGGFVIASGMVSQIGFAAVARLHAENADQALVVWTTVKVMQDALGGGVELLGGVWVLLLSAVLFRDIERTRTLAALSVIVGLAGVLTVIPSLDIMKAVFGLTQIVWFVWIGFWLLRRR